MSKQRQPFIFDQYLLAVTIAILAFGLLMVASASMAISERQSGAPFHFFFRQLIYVLMGLGAAVLVWRTEMEFWSRMSSILLIAGLLLLVVVLIPGIGREINGSRRWIGLIIFNLQVSEFVKLAVVIFMAGFLVRRNEEVRTQFSGFLKPMIILAIIALLLLKEPDFGATVVVTVTMLCMMYAAGVRVWQFMLLVAIIACALALLAITSPYRLQRLTTFLNPWAHQYDSGYQLTQSLIAFGRGGLFGVGLGASIQKLFYLPEAHTDFLFAVLSEELGLVGILAIIALYTVFVWRALLIGKRAQLNGMHAEGFMAYGFAVWMAMQTIVNMGVTAGLLPTKGLTLPLMSYGGSSMVIDCIVVALLLRIDYETRKFTPQNILKRRERARRLRRNN